VRYNAALAFPVSERHALLSEPSPEIRPGRVTPNRRPDEAIYATGLCDPAPGCYGKPHVCAAHHRQH